MQGNGEDDQDRVSKALGDLYARWGDLLRIACDPGRTYAERADALREVDSIIGEDEDGPKEYAPAEVDRIAAELLAEGLI